MASSSLPSRRAALASSPAPSIAPAPSRSLPLALLLLSLLHSSPAAAAPPLYTLDLRSLFGSAPADIAVRRDAYDTLVAATCLQGLANRNAPTLYLFYVTSAVDGKIDTDQLWFNRLQDPAIGADTVGNRPVTALANLDAAIDQFRPLFTGLVVWDERVPATVNAAFTAAGADDLLAVRFDASPSSLYSRLIKKNIPVKVWLINQDGTSRFNDLQGNFNIPDFPRKSSQSAKADVYVWTLEKYLKAGKLDPTELGWMLDARWIKDPRDYAGNANPTSQLQITNRDWLVARRGLPFDLSPWSDVAATDDPGQPVGTDVGVLRELLTAARSLATSRIITIRGFFAWQFKYTTLEGLPGGHEPVMGEWASVKLVSPFGAGLDADAPGVATMANASFVQQVPLDLAPEPQRRPTAEDLIGQGLLSGLAQNGGFEDGESGWTAHLTNHVVYDDPLTGAPRSHSGVRFLECNTNKVGDDLQDNLFRDGPAAAPGTRITLRAFVRSAGPPVDGELTIWATGGTQETQSTHFTAGADWTEVRTILDVKGGNHVATRGQIYLRTSNANLDVDDVAFYAGDAATAPVLPANYVLWFVGDYDAASWLASFTPVTWDAPGRGLVPLAWDFSGHVATRFPPFFRHALRTRTPRDFFVAADSGPGYGNPSQMDAPTRDIWANAGVAAARHLDTSIGWLLDPLAPVDAAHLQAVTPAFGDGVLLMSPGGVSPGTIVDHAPIVALDNMGGQDVPSAEAWILGATPSTPNAPSFHALRAVLWKNTDLVKIAHDLSTGQPARRYRFVDPYSFFALARQSFGGRTLHRASYRNVQIPDAVERGQKIHVQLTIRNDGWDTWGGANPHALGVHVSTDVPGVRTIPSMKGAYSTSFSIPGEVAPGAEVTLQFDLPAPQNAGHYTLQADVGDKTWFELEGDIPFQHPLTVTDPLAMSDLGMVTPDMRLTTPPDAAMPDLSPTTPHDRTGGCGCRVGRAPSLPGHLTALCLFGCLTMRRKRAKGRIKASIDTFPAKSEVD